jgi:ribosomal-protein-alanine N-acetyltransferase
MEITSKTIIETERFLLRRIVSTDLEGLFELDSDPDVHKYLGNNPLKSIKEAERVIEHIHKQYREVGLGRLAIIDKTTGEFIGWTGLKVEKEVRPTFQYFDIGYRMKKEFWGNGIATETATACLDYGFNILHLEEIHGAAVIENIASNKVLQKIGLKFIEEFQCDGEECNFYGISRDEWLKSSD